MSGSTATATTATAEVTRYVGRFAPSPTGSLHLGSLVAALGSFLEARRRGGHWLVRMEDLDSARVIPGCADEILRTLETFGFEWDRRVLYQSERTEMYREAWERLRSRGLTFECSCSRRARAEDPQQDRRGYPGTCRAGPQRPRTPTATRFRVDTSARMRFEDEIQGSCCLPLAALGDVIIRRRDGVFAYQLAVVVDDAAQQINHVVRGADLLESTAWQIALQQALDLPTPGYGHLPVILEPTGAKLAKSRRSLPIVAGTPGAQLTAALGLLNQPVVADLGDRPPRQVLEWATAHWDAGRFRGRRTLLAA